HISVCLCNIEQALHVFCISACLCNAGQYYTCSASVPACVTPDSTRYVQHQCLLV
ncbi:hypothetical protein LSAT2_026991, partial [Lamellibrachia satsuma]